MARVFVSTMDLEIQVETNQISIKMGWNKYMDSFTRKSFWFAKDGHFAGPIASLAEDVVIANRFV